jgi:hypothetical protein
MTASRPTAGADRMESFTLAVILTTVAVAAGWASFTHVHDWTMRHAPAGTPDLFGWVNAVISELVPVAAFLTIRRRRRTHSPIGYPVVLLIAAATLSLSAQLAVAQPSPSGWLLSAVPALAFMALVKLVFTTPVSPEHVGPTPDVSSTSDTTADTPDRTPAVAPIHTPASTPPPRPVAVVPVPAETFTRLNGVPVVGQVTR